MSKIVIESNEPVVYNREDNGYTLQYPVTNPTKPDDPFYIILQSHEEPDRRNNKPMHSTARLFAGKKVRITVEVLN